MRLLIDSEERKDVAYGLPWSSTATCLNFNVPTKTITSYDQIKRPKRIETLVINTELKDYEFIRKMENLTQLYIYRGANIADLSFLKNLVKIRQLCLIGLRVESLKELTDLINDKYAIYKEYDTSPYEETIARLTYGFEGIYIQSDLYKGDGTELLNKTICRYDVWVNGKRITPY